VRREWKFRLLVIQAFLCLGFGLVSGCSGWKPGEDGSASSYKKTPDGYYRVKRGDTLHAIAFKFGMDWRSIASLNGIQPPYTIYPDQDLRLSAPGSKSSSQSASTKGDGVVVTAAVPSRSSSSSTYEVTPDSKSASQPPETSSAQTTSAPEPVAKAPPPAVTSAPPVLGDPNKWLWPTDGKITSNFAPNDPARKGIDIGGNEGQAIVASAAGEVVYSGSGLIGYGELVIIKHNERLLSAYAHNQKRLVKEGQSVAAGERIANMGKNDRNQAMLHFEIRLNGNPQNPLKYLPAR